MKSRTTESEYKYRFKNFKVFIVKETLPSTGIQEEKTI